MCILSKLVDPAQINIISSNVFTSIIGKLTVFNFVLIVQPKYVSLQCNLFSSHLLITFVTVHDSLEEQEPL